ncbi:cation:proton antiporter [Desulfosediminicola flagellatus]|uniref:cation:proton antiporter domain-containing protein n=1 Tax=Desulfosediminicola flagellatus TaxID=2569541 RepID=UPI0010AD8AEF|nr:cation:proton antiporter [Desulfosediminicola flagellatus]
MVTFSIAILLASGLAVSKICQRFHLPTVTGYILAGMLLGPTGFDIISEDRIGDNLTHFTQIALMLIAFGIGEHIELKKLKEHTRSLKWIGFFEAAAAFTVVTTAIYSTIYLTGFEVVGWAPRDYIVLSMLLGSIGIATAPAATLLVIRELKAKGPLTSTLMAIVAIDDGLAIIIFGLIVSIAHQVLGFSGNPLLISIGGSAIEIIGSLLLGLLTGTILVMILGKLQELSEIMTAGLATLLLCGEIALFLHLSPLLAGMAAGFCLVNKAERDVRVFRALNSFEPPIYVLFFTLAGTHLDIQSLRNAGILGIIYFLSTVSGKICGVNIGAQLANSPAEVRKYLGFAMVPQAGVAIGLIFLLSSDEILMPYAEVITPIVLTGVFLSELIGPVSARFALTRAGEVHKSQEEKLDETGASICSLDETFRIIPWKWRKLKMTKDPEGFIIFHAVEQTTARGLARTATILAYYNKCLPMSVRLLPTEKDHKDLDHLFYDEHAEVQNMGSNLVTELAPGPDLAAGLVAAVECHNTKALVLAYPLKGDIAAFQELFDTVARHVHCPVTVVRFYGELHTERILVPLTDIDELDDMFEIIAALASVGEHRLNLLYMMSSEAEPKDIIAREREIEEWLSKQQHQPTVSIMAVPTDSRLDMIIESAEEADLVVMGSRQTSNMARILFGSLVDSVAAKLRKTLIVVYNAGKHSRK